jgi:hypothetical protein
MGQESNQPEELNVKKSIDVYHRKGETWQRMLMALGSRKPWVPRSIREWGVIVRKNNVEFGWHHILGRPRKFARMERQYVRTARPIIETGSSVAVAHNNFQLAMAFVLFGGLRGYASTHVAMTAQGLAPCSADHPNICLFLSPKWIVFVDGESATPVPTKLVIEAMRLIRQDRRSDLLVSRGRYRDKHARPFFRRLDEAKRRKYVREVGQHNCWSIMVEVAHTIRDMKKKDVKDLEVRPIEDPNEMPAGER